MEKQLAPCIAIVGPANSGKTTLVDLLDAALQLHPEQPLVYVQKGSPDATGRYLFYAPELRAELKENVKGRWSPETPGSLCEFIDNCRSNLELVLLDFGGKHDPVNDEILPHCTHYLVVSRFQDDEGATSWASVCERHGLQPVALFRSLWEEGEPEVHEGDILQGTFRSDKASPDKDWNRRVVDRITESLIRLRLRTPPPPYLDLRLERDWTLEDLPDLGGLGPALDRLVDRGEPVFLGGRAPIWAYHSALHRVLDRNPEALVDVFDPKLPRERVEIPRSIEPVPDSLLAQSIAVRWYPKEGGDGATLHVQIRTPDRILRPGLELAPSSAPLPSGAPPTGPLVISGMPIWLHLTYARWVRTIAPGVPIGSWDARTRAAVFVRGPGAPWAEAMPHPYEPFSPS